MKQLLEFIFNHWELWVSFGILLILLLIYEIKSHHSQTIKVSPQEAVLLINQDALVIDIREHEQFAKGHIIHSIQAKRDDYQSKKMTQHKERAILLVCQRGETAQGIASQWMAAGYSRVSVLSGGIDAWKEAGFPLV